MWQIAFALYLVQSRIYPTSACGHVAPFRKKAVAPSDERLQELAGMAGILVFLDASRELQEIINLNNWKRCHWRKQALELAGQEHQEARCAPEFCDRTPCL